MPLESWQIGCWESWLSSKRQQLWIAFFLGALLNFIRIYHGCFAILISPTTAIHQRRLSFPEHMLAMFVFLRALDRCCGWKCDLWFQPLFRSREPSETGPADSERHRWSPSVIIKLIKWRNMDSLGACSVPRQKQETQSSSCRTPFPTTHSASSQCERVTGSRPCWRPAVSWRWRESCTGWVSAAVLVWAGNAPSGSSGRSPASRPSEAPTNKETFQLGNEAVVHCRGYWLKKAEGSSRTRG